MIFRTADGGKHGLERGGTILQQQHLVSHHQRAAHDGCFERQMPIKDISFIAVAFEPIENLLALLGRKGTVCAAELHSLGATGPEIRRNGWQHTASTGDREHHQQDRSQCHWNTSRQSGTTAQRRQSA
ncbi:hypothetical protein FQZ97_866840 [compost metagenome]